jgi:hypothetical protein
MDDFFSMKSITKAKAPIVHTETTHDEQGDDPLNSYFRSKAKLSMN